MPTIKELGSDLRAQLDQYLSELRESDAVKKWLSNKHFLAMYEWYETNVRASLADAIRKYELQAEAAAEKEQDYRDAVIITIKETLELYLNSFKRIMSASATSMISAFEATRRD